MFFQRTLAEMAMRRRSVSCRILHFFFKLFAPLDNPARGERESGQICSGSIREMAEIAKIRKKNILRTENK